MGLSPLYLLAMVGSIRHCHGIQRLLVCRVSTTKASQIPYKREKEIQFWGLDTEFLLKCGQGVGHLRRALLNCFYFFINCVAI